MRNNSNLKKYTVEIKNNPGETTLNYGDTIKLTAVVLYEGEPVEGLTAANYKWTADSSAVKLTSYGETCEVEAVKAGVATVTLEILDEEGNSLSGYAVADDEGNVNYVFSDSQTITVKAGFFEKLISFFKNLFGIDRTIIQSI